MTDHYTVTPESADLVDESIAEIQSLHRCADEHGVTPEIVDRINLAVDQLANLPQCRVCGASLNQARTRCPLNEEDERDETDCLHLSLEEDTP